jgi:hypothetical protein
MRKLSVAALVSLFLSLFTLTVPASASSIQPSNLDFLGGTGGTVSFTPAVGSSLDITGAPISFVSGSPDSTHFTITGGLLDVITGACETGCKINPKTGSSLDFFADGGVLEIFGGIPSAGIPDGTLLLKGTFDSLLTPPGGFRSHCELTEADLAGKLGGGMSGCVAVSDINPTLLADLGFPPLKTSGEGYESQMFLDVTLSLGSYTGTVKSTDIIVHPMAEPATLALMGVGLLFLGSMTRKFMSR